MKCGGVIVKLNRAIERLLLSVSLAVSAVACGQLAVRAEMTRLADPAAEPPTLAASELAIRSLTPQAQAGSDQPQLHDATFSNEALTPQATTAVLASALAPAAPSTLLPLQPVETSSAGTDTAPIAANATALVVPVPGTVSTSVAAFTSDGSLSSNASKSATVELQPAAEPQTSVLAQAEPITPGRATRSGSSYVGVGANIGAIGRTPLGDLSGAILSKIGLTRTISVRPAVLINGDATFLLPLTLDFPIERAERVSFAPYVGVGASFSTGDRKNADLIVSGGVDIPLSSQFTLTAAANAGLINGVELGVLVGIGYNFAGF
jgi:hypothetical protein